jgi:hypothetical protein
LCKVANHATVTRENISRRETGKRTPGPWWLRHLATVLQVPIALLEQTGVDRRHFLTNVVGASIAPLVASDLIEHGFAAALYGSYPSADDWGHAVVTYGRDYTTSGAAEIQKRLAADLVVLQQQLDSPCLWLSAPSWRPSMERRFPVATASTHSRGIGMRLRSPIDPRMRTPESGFVVGRPSRWVMRARVLMPPMCSPSKRSLWMPGRRSGGSTQSWQGVRRRRVRRC